MMTVPVSCCRCPDTGPLRGSRMTAPDEDYGRRERLLLHHSHQYPPPGPTPQPGAGERYIPAPTPPPGDRYIPTSGERYIPSSGERYHQSSSASDRFLATSSSADRYLSPADRFLPTAASVTSDRYLPPPAPAPSDRFLPPSTPAPGERYLPPPPSATPGGPGDPYMRRDLGYHHHYRLPHPSYNPHHPHHQYHSHYHHQRALPTAPHHRSLNYHAHMAPSPNRNHNRCCPSPSHYGPSADPPYILSSAGSPGNGSAANTPSASGSGSGGTSGVVMLAAVTGSGTAAGTSSSSSASPVTVPSASVSTTREYMTSPSPLLSHRGRTPPCSVVSQRPSVSGNNVASSASNVPVIEYVGASGGRHVSTPTPPPPAILPRCGSLSSCDLGIENPLCGSGDAISNSTGSVGTITHHQHHHHHNHLQQQPPQRRGCSGVLETFDTQGSTVSLCCGNSRRYPVHQQQVNVSVTSAGDMTPCVTTTAPSITRPESRQSLAASAATTPSHPPLQHSTPHHTAVW